MIYYCMSDIHGCIYAFEDALDIILPKLREPGTVLMLLGDYIHDGDDSAAVLDRIMELRRQFGERVIALMGNHEEMVIEGRMSVEGYGYSSDEKYLGFLRSLPRYHSDGKTIFVHAGIEEQAGDMWKWGTPEYVFTGKYPAQTGHFFEDWRIVAGHVGTSELAGDPRFHGIYYDGGSHYYIDASAPVSGYLNILKADTERHEYFEVTADGEREVRTYLGQIRDER